MRQRAYEIISAYEAAVERAERADEEVMEAYRQKIEAALSVCNLLKEVGPLHTGKKLYSSPAGAGGFEVVTIGTFYLDSKFDEPEPAAPASEYDINPEAVKTEATNAA